MPDKTQTGLQQARQWVRFWRAWGKPCISLPAGFPPGPCSEFLGCLGESPIDYYLDGDAFEHDGLWMQPFRVEANGINISRLVAELAGLPFFENQLIILCDEPWREGMMSVAMAVLAAHLNAASALDDIEAMRGLDPAFSGEQIARIEARLLARATSDDAGSAADIPRPKRRRL